MMTNVAALRPTEIECALSLNPGEHRSAISVTSTVKNSEESSAETRRDV